MKLPRWPSALLFTLIFSAHIWAAGKENQKEPSGQKVDAGSFGVFLGGRRAGTETFSIVQNASGSVIQSEFKTEGAENGAAQSSELQLTASGDLRRYDWKELSPGKGQLTVLPGEQTLSEKWSASPQDKQQEQTFLLPAATSILDDYFFVHREVLAWRFLASSCKQEKGQVQCPLKQRMQFGTLNPHQRASSPISMEFLGREKATLHGSEQDLNRLELKSEDGNWTLWLDDQFKLLRIFIPGENTEVVRD